MSLVSKCFPFLRKITKRTAAAEIGTSVYSISAAQTTVESCEISSIKDETIENGYVLNNTEPKFEPKNPR